MAKYYVCDRKTIIEINTTTNVTGASLLKFYIRRPNGSIIIVTGTAFDTTWIRYITTGNELSLPGTYMLMSYMEDGSGGKFYGDTFEFEMRNLFT